MKTPKMLMLFAATLCLAASAYAQDYPLKPVKVIVPYTEGSATDVIARMVSAKLSELWGQPVIIENRAGAGGSTGTSDAAKSPPDGYTLLVHSNSFSVNLATYALPPYSRKDFVDIAPFASQPYTLVASPAAGLKSVSELIAAAKAKPGQIKFGSAGIGSATHLVAEKFNTEAGINAPHVPYKGGPEANAATSSGEVTYWFPPSAIALKGVKEGKLLALGVSSSTRFGLLPEVPTIAETGIAGFNVSGWWGVWAPAGIPANVKDKLVKDVARALAAPDLREKLGKSGFVPMSMTPAEFTKLVQSELDSAASILKAAGIKPQ